MFIKKLFQLLDPAILLSIFIAAASLAILPPAGHQGLTIKEIALFLLFSFVAGFAIYWQISQFVGQSQNTNSD